MATQDEKGDTKWELDWLGELLSKEQRKAVIAIMKALLKKK